MADVSPFVGLNYFPGDVDIDVPADYFLQRVYDYDAKLVLFPSQKVPGAYVVARRRDRTPGIGPKALAAFVNPDTRLCVAMGWVPVCMMFKTGLSWNPDGIIAKLKARDIWEHGGADKVADLLEADEAAEETARRKAIRDDMWNRSGDGWRTYQARTGQNNILPHGELPKRTTPAPEAAVSTASTLRSTGTSGLSTSSGFSRL